MWNLWNLKGNSYLVHLITFILQGLGVLDSVLRIRSLLLLK